MKSLPRQLYLKLPVLAAFAVVVLALSLGTSLRGSIYGAWNMIRIPANTYPFSDAGCLLYAIDNVQAGIDPYVANPGEPLNRPYNYPPLWLGLRYLGIGSRSLTLLGVLFAATAVIGYLLLFNCRTLLSGILVFLALTSKAVLFAIERGNNDQFVFFVLVVGLFLIYCQRPELRARLTSILLVCLAVLKIYPIATVTLFLERRRGWLRTTLTGLAAVLAVLLTCGHKLPLIFANTPRDVDQSFGSFPFLYALGTHTLRSVVPTIMQNHAVAPVAALLMGGLCMLAGASSGTGLDRFLPPLDRSRARGAIAIACLSIFCFVFIGGASYNYRLLYLTGVLAWLIEDIDTSSTRRSVPAAVLIVLLLWKPFWLSIAGETADGLVFLMSSIWLGNALLARREAEQELPYARPAARQNPSFAPPVR